MCILYVHIERTYRKTYKMNISKKNEHIPKQMKMNIQTKVNIPKSMNIPKT